MYFVHVLHVVCTCTCTCITVLHALRMGMSLSLENRFDICNNITLLQQGLHYCSCIPYKYDNRNKPVASTG